MNLKSIYQLYAEHKEGAWITQPDNARALFSYVKEHPVKNILELGTGIGCSTAVMAYALYEKGEGGMIHTVEQNDKCYKLAQELLPEELKPYVTFHKSDVRVWNTEMIPYQFFSTFDTLPDIEFDLALVDGPSPSLEGDKFIELPNGDIIKLLIEDKIKAGTLIAWDGRLTALALLERYFGSNFFLEHVGQARFNVIERKDNPLQFEDIKLQDMKKAGYV